MSNLTIFQFESQEVRFVGTADDPWWVAADVCAVLGLNRDTHKHMIKLKDTEKTRKSFPGVDNPEGAWCVNEFGVYRLVFRSNKPVAERFQYWVYHEVLPTIRKTGSYAMPRAVREATIAQPQKQPPQLLPTPAEISEVVDLILGQTGLDPKLVAGAKGNAIARLHPQHTVTIESAKALLSTPVESNLVRPTVLAERLTETTGEKWSAIQVNKVLIEQDFQIKNPDGKNPAYLPTEKGKEYGQLVLDTARGRDKTIQSLQWHLSVLEALEANDH